MKKLFLGLILGSFSMLSFAQGVADYQKFLNQGRAFADQQKFAEAILEFDKAIAKMPYYSALYYERGLAKMQLKNYESAILDFNQAIQQKSYDVKFYLQRGIAYYQTQQYELATTDLEKVLQYEPQQTEAITYYNLANQNLAKIEADNQRLMNQNLLAQQTQVYNQKQLQRQWRRQIRNQIIWNTVVPMGIWTTFWLLR